MGVTGSDLMGESGVQLTTRLSLGIGQCRLSICVPEDSAYSTPKDLAGCRVATSFRGLPSRISPNMQRRSIWYRCPVPSRSW